MVIDRRTVLPLIFLLFVSSAVALDFEVIVPQIQVLIKLNETASVPFTINNLGTERTFEIYSPDVAWDLATNPPEDRLLTVESLGSATTELVLRPLYVTPGYHVIPIHVRPIGSKDLIRKNVLIGVTSLAPTPKDYEPAVRVSLRAPSSIDPRNELKLQVTLENRNRRAINAARIKVVGDLVAGEQTVTLDPLATSTLDFVFTLDPKTGPHEDMIKISLFVEANGRTYRFDGEPVTYSVEPYGKVEETTSKTARFLKAKQEVVLTNTGNTPREHSFRVKMPFFKRLFSSAAPEPRKIATPEGTFWEWSHYFEVGETQQISIKTSYRSILWFVLFVIAGVVAYYLFRSPVVLTKSAMILETREQGISELKVLIELKNRSNHAVKNLSIIDKVPSLVHIAEKHEMGTLAPTKIVKDEAGDSLVKWTLEELDGLEERVLSYKIKSRLSILGDLRLPVAVAHFESKQGTKRKTASNITQIGFGH